MENLSKNFYHYPRRFNLAPPVGVVGFVPDKKDYVHNTFKSCNFSFIMRGKGKYRNNGIDYRVTAPSVILQWPDETMYYGPDDTWDEIYFIYPGEIKERLISSGLFDINRFMWKINESYEISKMFDELYELVSLPFEQGLADRIDLLCSKIVMDSLTMNSSKTLNPQEKIIGEIADEFRRVPGKLFDFEEIAHKNNMSLSTFRRLWLKYRKVPPARFLADLKVDAACHLLTSTRLSINEIADELNFSDPLYFSRFFRQKTGFSATEYRRINNP